MKNLTIDDIQFQNLSHHAFFILRLSNEITVNHVRIIHKDVIVETRIHYIDVNSLEQEVSKTFAKKRDKETTVKLIVLINVLRSLNILSPR